MYAYLSDAAIHVLQRHSVAAQLSTLARPTETAAAKATPLPFVLRYEWNPAQVEVLSGTSVGIGSAWGYRLIPANTSNFTVFTFTASLHSLSSDVAAPATATELTLTVGGDATAKTATKRLPPMGASNTTWTLDLSPHATGPGAVVELEVGVAGAGAAAAIALPLKVMMHLGEWGCLASDTVPKENLCV